MKLYLAARFNRMKEMAALAPDILKRGHTITAQWITGKEDATGMTRRQAAVMDAADVREADAPLVHVDAPVEVSVLALPGQTFKAKLSYVAATVDPTTHRLPVPTTLRLLETQTRRERYPLSTKRWKTISRCSRKR